MRKKDFKEKVHGMNIQDLYIQANEIRKELFVLRMKKVSSPEKNTALPRVLRKNLACVLTLLKQKGHHGA